MPRAVRMAFHDPATFSRGPATARAARFVGIGQRLRVDGPHGSEDRIGLPRERAGQELVQGHAERPDVGRGVTVD